jgi:hypothetical protein
MLVVVVVYVEEGVKSTTFVEKFDYWPSYKKEEDDGCWYEPGDADFDISIDKNRKSAKFAQVLSNVTSDADEAKKQQYDRSPLLLVRDVLQGMPAELGPPVIENVSPKGVIELNVLEQRMVLLGDGGSPYKGTGLEFQQGRIQKPFTEAELVKQREAAGKFHLAKTRTIGLNTLITQTDMDLLLTGEDFTEAVKLDSIRRKAEQDPLNYGNRVAPTTSKSLVRALNLQTFNISSLMHRRMAACQKSHEQMKFCHQLAGLETSIDDLDVYWETKDLREASVEYIREMDLLRGRATGNAVRRLVIPGLVRSVNPACLVGRLDRRDIFWKGDHQRLLQEERRPSVWLKDFVDNNAYYHAGRTAVEAVQDSQDADGNWSDHPNDRWPVDPGYDTDDRAAVEYVTNVLISRWEAENRRRGRTILNGERNKLRIFNFCNERLHFFRQMDVAHQARSCLSASKEEWRKKEISRLKEESAKLGPTPDVALVMWKELPEHIQYKMDRTPVTEVVRQKMIQSRERAIREGLDPNELFNAWMRSRNLEVHHSLRYHADDLEADKVFDFNIPSTSLGRSGVVDFQLRMIDQRIRGKDRKKREQACLKKVKEIRAARAVELAKVAEAQRALDEEKAKQDEDDTMKKILEKRLAARKDKLSEMTAEEYFDSSHDEIQTSIHNVSLCNIILEDAPVIAVPHEVRSRVSVGDQPGTSGLQLSGTGEVGSEQEAERMEVDPVEPVRSEQRTEEAMETEDTVRAPVRSKVQELAEKYPVRRVRFDDQEKDPSALVQAGSARQFKDIPPLLEVSAEKVPSPGTSLEIVEDPSQASVRDPTIIPRAPSESFHLTDVEWDKSIDWSMTEPSQPQGPSSSVPAAERELMTAESFSTPEQLKEWEDRRRAEAEEAAKWPKQPDVVTAAVERRLEEEMRQEGVDMSSTTTGAGTTDTMAAVRSLTGLEIERPIFNLAEQLATEMVFGKEPRRRRAKKAPVSFAEPAANPVSPRRPLFGRSPEHTSPEAPVRPHRLTFTQEELESLPEEEREKEAPLTALEDSALRVLEGSPLRSPGRASRAQSLSTSGDTYVFGQDRPPRLGQSLSTSGDTFVFGQGRPPRLDTSESQAGEVEAATKVKGPCVIDNTNTPLTDAQVRQAIDEVLGDYPDQFKDLIAKAMVTGEPVPEEDQIRDEDGNLVKRLYIHHEGIEVMRDIFQEHRGWIFVPAASGGTSLTEQSRRELSQVVEDLGGAGPLLPAGHDTIVAGGSGPSPRRPEVQEPQPGTSTGIRAPVREAEAVADTSSLISESILAEVQEAIQPDRQVDVDESDRIFLELVACPEERPSEDPRIRHWWRGKVLVTKEVDMLQMTQVAQYHPCMAGILWNLDLHPLCNIFLHPAVRDEVIGHIQGFFTDDQTSRPFISRIRPLEGLEAGWALLRPIVNGNPPFVPRRADRSFGRISFDHEDGGSTQPRAEPKDGDDTQKKKPVPSEEGGAPSGGDDDDDGDDSPPGARVGIGARKKIRKLPDTSSSEERSEKEPAPGSATKIRPQVAKKTTLSTLTTPRKDPVRPLSGDTSEEEAMTPPPYVAATPTRGRGRARTRGSRIPTPRGRGRGGRGGAGAATPGTSSTPSGGATPAASFSTPKSTSKGSKGSFQAVIIGGDGSSHCGVCDRSFQTIEECEEHITEAHPDKPQHVCKICGYGFGTKNSLYTHKNKKHTGAKPQEKKLDEYPCPGCKKVYLHRGSRNRHQNKDKCGLGLTWGWQCPVCQLTFPNQNARNQHMNLAHPGQPKPGKDEGVVVVVSHR